MPHLVPVVVDAAPSLDGLAEVEALSLGLRLEGLALAVGSLELEQDALEVTLATDPALVFLPAGLGHDQARGELPGGDLDVDLLTFVAGRGRRRGHGMDRELLARLAGLADHGSPDLARGLLDHEAHDRVLGAEGRQAFAGLEAPALALLTDDGQEMLEDVPCGLGLDLNPEPDLDPLAEGNHGRALDHLGQVHLVAAVARAVGDGRGRAGNGGLEGEGLLDLRRAHDLARVVDLELLEGRLELFAREGHLPATLIVLGVADEAEGRLALEHLAAARELELEALEELLGVVALLDPHPGALLELPGHALAVVLDLEHGARVGPLPDPGEARGCLGVRGWLLLLGLVVGHDRDRRAPPPEGQQQDQETRRASWGHRASRAPAMARAGLVIAPLGLRVEACPVPGPTRAARPRTAALTRAGSSHGLRYLR